jgi:hypothetical protein
MAGALQDGEFAINGAVTGAALLPLGTVVWIRSLVISTARVSSK